MGFVKNEINGIDIIMELISGGSIQDLLKKFKSFN